MPVYKTIIREATSNDIPQITEIYNHYILHSVETFEVEAVSCEEMKRRMEEVLKTGPFLVCTNRKGSVLGYAYAHPWKERRAYYNTYETTVYVNPDFLHKKIGTQLMTALIAQCRERSIHALIACITDGNQASKGLHKKLGFERVSHFKEVGIKFNLLLDVVDYELVIPNG